MADKSAVYTALTGYAGLTALVPVSRIWYGRVPRNVASPTTLPYLLYRRVTSVPENPLSGNPGIDQYRIQFDIYAATTASAEAILVQLRAALAGNGYEVLAQDFSEFEPDAERISVDWEFWLNR